MESATIKCPKCEYRIPPGMDTCPSCGVIPAKYRPRPEIQYQAAPEQAAAFVDHRPVCQACKKPGQVAHAELRQNIGALYLRFSRRVNGDLCRPCLDRYFWTYTLVTTAVGWLGIISLVLAPIYVIGNISSYVKARGQLSRQLARLGSRPSMA
jgi:hypothetical protein